MQKLVKAAPQTSEVEMGFLIRDAGKIQSDSYTILG